MLTALILILIVLGVISYILIVMLMLVIRATASIESLYDITAKTSAKEIAEKFAKHGYRIVKEED